MQSKRQILFQEIMQKIQDGSFVAGGRILTEREIAARLNVSRFAVREALGALEAIGVVEVRDRQGTFLRETERADGVALDLMRYMPASGLSQVMEARFLIEVPAAGLAALRHTERDAAVIRDCLCHLEELHERPYSVETGRHGAQWNTALHTAIVHASQNEALARLFESLMIHMERDIALLRIRYMDTPKIDYSERILNDHRRLVGAILEGQSEEAQRIAEEHLRRTVGNFADQGRPGFQSDNSTLRLLLRLRLTPPAEVK